MIRRDLVLAIAIGAAVGLLIQPVMANLAKGSHILSGLIGGGGLTSGTRVVILIAFAIFAPVALGVAYFIGKIWPVIYQFAKFAAVGTLNTFIDFGVLNLLSLATGVTSGAMIPVFATAAFLGATTNSFLWNKFWTFDSKSRAQAGEAFKFLAVSAGGWALNVIAVSVIVNYFRPSAISPEVWLNIGGLAGVAAAFIWNFLGYKFFVFGMG